MAKDSRVYTENGFSVKELVYPAGSDFSILVVIKKYRGELNQYFGELWWHPDISSYNVSTIETIRQSGVKIAHTDHDPSNTVGHDATDPNDPKGLHIDVHEHSNDGYSATILLRSKGYPPNNAGTALTQALNYMRKHKQWILEVYIGKRNGTKPPGSTRLY